MRIYTSFYQKHNTGSRPVNFWGSGYDQDKNQWLITSNLSQVRVLAFFATEKKHPFR